MRRTRTALVALAAVAALALAGCTTDGDGVEVDPDPVDTETEAVTTDDGEATFGSATASVEVSGDLSGAFSLTTVRTATLAAGILDATIASSDPGEVLSFRAPAEQSTSTTGTDEVSLRLEITTEDGTLHTFVAGDGTCSITTAPGDVAFQGTFECTGLTSNDGDTTIDASGSFALNRD